MFKIMLLEQALEQIMSLQLVVLRLTQVTQMFHKNTKIMLPFAENLPSELRGKYFGNLETITRVLDQIDLEDFE